MQSYSVRDLIIETVSRLYIYTDQLNWQGLMDEVFADSVDFDMSSLGGVNDKITAREICDQWASGFKGIDSINHLAGNYLVDIGEAEASVLAYATATHYRKDAENGNTREFVGTYDLHLILTGGGWRKDGFRYTVKYMSGNLDLS